jgi:hypothetical protein
MLTVAEHRTSAERQAASARRGSMPAVVAIGNSSLYLLCRPEHDNDVTRFYEE